MPSVHRLRKSGASPPRPSRGLDRTGARARPDRPVRPALAQRGPDRGRRRGAARDRRQHRSQPERDHVDPRPLPGAGADRGGRDRMSRLGCCGARPGLRHVPPYGAVHALPPPPLPRPRGAARGQGSRDGHHQRGARSGSSATSARWSRARRPTSCSSTCASRTSIRLCCR